MRKTKLLKRGTTMALSVLSGAAFLGGWAFQSDFWQANASSYFTVDTSATMQTMDGWGTSLCWWANAAGGWDMEGVTGKTKREELVDLVFGADGLNLNIARYNIPGGDDPLHTHMVNYRGMTLLKPSAEADYDWDADSNQMWILDAAYKLRNQDLYVETFNNSAPYWMTVSGCSSGGAKKSDENLPLENYQAYAEYYADVVNYLQTEMGIPVTSVEVMNEPDSDYWGAFGSQEGCKVSKGAHQSQLIKTVYNEIVKRNLKSASGNDFLWAAPDETNPAMAYASYNALDGEAKNIVGKLNYHTYQRTEADRKNMCTLVGYNDDYTQQRNKIWMSETCYGSGGGKGEDYPDNHNTMVDAFDMAADIYGDLYHAKANAWIIWQAMETELENRDKGCNYGLIHGVYQDPGNSEYGFDLDLMALNRGDYFITKQYYSMGQYSRYIKAGYKIVQSPSPEYVIAISPTNDELVIVYANKNKTAENISLYLKGFECESAKKIVTDENVNWQESKPEVSGSYLDFTSNAESITTIVIKGSKTDAAAEHGSFFKSFIQRSETLRAEFRLEDIRNSEYKFYYADDKAKLPVNGGATAEYEVFTPTESDCSITLKEKTGEVYYGVLAQTIDGKTYYSRVLKANSKERETNDFTYLTLCGRTDKMSLANTGYSFGGNYGVADQPFGEDPFTGKTWGYVGEDRDTAEYSSNEFLQSARYATGSEIIYRYEVAANTDYAVSVLFLDPWNASDRAMTVEVSGRTSQKAQVTNTNQLTAVHAENVKGARESGKYYITVKITGETQSPAVNLISVQTADQAEQVFGVKPVRGVVQEQGKPIADVLPDWLELVTSKGTATTESVAYTEINYTDALKKGGGSAVVKGIANERFSFEFPVAMQDATEETFYYIDAGALAPTTELKEKFELFKLTNPNLVNTDTVDKFAQNENDWGRLGTPSDYSDYWENYPDKMESVVEGKYIIRRDGAEKKAVQYRLTDLPVGKYSVVVGVDVKTWGSNKRDVVIEMGDKKLGEQSGYSGPNEWIYEYEKDNADPVVFTIYSKGSANPVLAYVLVKRVFSVGEKLDSPFLPAGITKNTKELTITNVSVAGALLTLTDDAGKLIAEHTVTADEAAAGSVALRELDLKGSASISATLYKDGVESSSSTAEFASLILSKPRVEWSAESDVISIVPSGNNIKSIDWRDGTDGEWINIKTTKFFRPTHNGVYYVRILTTENVEIIETVEVTHVDTVEMLVENDLTAWVDEAYNLTLDFTKSPRDIVKVTISDGMTETDITASGENKKFTYRIEREGNYTIFAETDLGTTKTFEITGCRFETIPVNLQYELKLDNGVYSVEFESESDGGVNYSYNVNGGEFVPLLQTKVPLVKEGNYIYKVTNMAGREAEVNVVYSSSFQKGAPVYANVTKGENADTFEFTFLEGLDNIRFVRLDGKGGEVKIENNAASISESGLYAVTAQKGDTLYVTSVFVNRNAAEESGESGNGNNTGAIIGVSVATAVVAAGFLGTIIGLWRKKKNG